MWIPALYVLDFPEGDLGLRCDGMEDRCRLLQQNPQSLAFVTEQAPRTELLGVVSHKFFGGHRGAWEPSYSHDLGEAKRRRRVQEWLDLSWRTTSASR